MTTPHDKALEAANDAYCSAAEDSTIAMQSAVTAYLSSIGEVMTTPHETAISQDTIDLVASALESADIGHTMSLTRLVDGIHTYTLKIRGEIETFVDRDEANAIDQVYARIKEAKHRLQAESVIAALHAPLPIAGKGDEGWMPIETAPYVPRQRILLTDGDKTLIGGRLHICTGQLSQTDFWNCQDGSGYNQEFRFKPTHWRPLPAPPSLLSEDTEGGV